MNTSLLDPRVARVVRFYEQLRHEDLPRLAELYHEEARFKDPFNDVQGTAGVRGVFEHMFASLQAPRFEVREAVAQADQAFLVWDFHFGLQGRRQTAGKPMKIHGSTHLRFAADGRVLVHRDYWDAAEELYAKLPYLGAFMRWLQRRARG